MSRSLRSGDLSGLDLRFERHRTLWAGVEGQLPPGELAHDRWHLQRVYRWALSLAPAARADADCCGAAALVHDLAVIPKNHPDRPQGGERSALQAGDLLREAGYDAGEMLQITEAVRTSSWSRGLPPANPIGVVLQDADRLDAIGMVGLMRLTACAQWMSRPERPGTFYHATDPFAASGRALDDRQHAIDHCKAKLLTLAAGMHLAPARQEAARRHQFLLAALTELAEELASGEPMGTPGHRG